MIDPQTGRTGRYEEQRFQLLVNSIVDYAIYMLDPDGMITTWNAGAERFKGYRADEIIGQHFSRFFTEEDRASGLPARALGIAASEGRFEAEGVRVRKDGSRFWAHAILDPIRDDAGILVGFAKITRDISEARARERALFESEQRFRMLVESVRDYAIYMLDRDGIVTNWNAGAEAIKGYTADEIVGQHFSRFYTEEDRAAGMPARALEAALRDGKYENEAVRVRKDGSPFWASVVIDPIFSETGEHVGFAKVTRDVTDRRRAAAELEEARAVSAQSKKLQALGELTGGIAHDFNNLLTVIAGSADFLLQRPDISPDKRIRYLEAIVETTERAARLTSHLLAFGRRQSLRPEVVDLHVRLDAVSEVLARTLGSAIMIELDLAATSAHVEVDPAELETAILNAAINARDAMPDGGTLTISTSDLTESGCEYVCIAIADTGTGMTAEILERAFEPFFTTKEVGKGTGLGLSQIHGFAAQAGGRAEVRSAVGEGTSVRLVLPRSAKQPAPCADERDITPLPAALRVLLVEDNDQVRAFAREMLADMGCEVIVAEDGKRALEWLQGGHVDIVFSDIVMPGITGLQLAETLRATRPHLPVLLATGCSPDVVADAGSLDIVRKPYDAHSLSAALSRVIARHRSRAA